MPRIKKIDIPVDRVMEFIDYDPETGLLTWKKKKGRGEAGSAAGFYDRAGYRKIEIDGRSYMAHRLIFYITYGREPVEIDHINGVRDDNRLCNLRDSTRETNMHNQCLRKDNKSGIKGVFWHSQSQKWRAEIERNKQRYCLGPFDSKEDARDAVMSLRERLHKDFCNHGDK